MNETALALPSWQQLQDWASAYGFQQIGVTDIDVGAHGDHLQRWLAAHYHGDMAWMEKHLDLRLHPDQLQPGTLRILSLRMDYLPPGCDGDSILQQLNDEGGAYIARYTLGRDYHKLVRKRLAQLAAHIETQTAHRYRAFVDSGPILERAFAEKAGLGWIGKNTMLIHPRAGSFFFLGEILTDLPLQTTAATHGLHCGSCTACLDTCPTQAFVAPHQLDARRCIAYLTIEYKGSIPLALRPLIGNRIFGCDDCQAVCPWNKFAQPAVEADFLPRHALDYASLVELFGWSEAEYLQKTEGSALRRIGYEGWLRNVAVALGNAKPTPAIRAALLSRQDDASALVREHVAWALSRHPV